MQLKKGEIISVKIEKLAFGGAGIGYFKIDDRKVVVFVENTVPGDEVDASLTKIKQNYFEAKLEKVTKKSELRVEPRCKHFEICGGCSMQNVPYEKQVYYKESHVKESLEHIGGFDDVEVSPIIACSDPWFYRNKMEFSFDADENGDVAAGLHPKHRRYDVFELEECFLENEDIGRLVNGFQKFAREHSIKSYNFRANAGLLRSLTIREGKRTGERLVNLLTSSESFNYEKEFVDFLTNNSDFNAATTIYLTQQIVEKGKRTEFKEKLLYGDKSLLEEIQLENGSTLKFEILPRAFFQTNTFQAEILYDTVLKLGDISKDDIIFDLFCGTGTIGLFCAHKAKKVIGVDINKSAIENAKENAKINSISNIDFEVGDTLKIASEFKDKPDVVIVDPPRIGLGEKLCEHLLEIKAPQIVYVSCNPTTLARDLKQLCKTYKLETVQPVDMFPHTYHIETVCKLQIR